MNPEERENMGFDWREIRRRLEDSVAKGAQGWAVDDETVKKILAVRARVLAREVEQKSEGETLEVVEFDLASERYGVEMTFVREVYPLRDLVPIPCTPPFIRGIINVRGRLISLTDLKVFFDLPNVGLGGMNRVIIITGGGMETGLLADRVERVRSVPVATLQEKVTTFVGIRGEYLRGVTEDRIAILDAARILADPGLVVDEEA